MFVLSPDPQFTAEVKVQVPTLTGPEEQTFTARFRALQLDELPKTDPIFSEATRTFLQRVFCGWGDNLVGEDRKPLAYSDDTRDVLIDTPYLREPLVKAYFQGLTPAARGN